ncbi:MAG: PQQ-binding-like beta-propeller repeat protein [Acidobacteria bacterium]|nr:PQQ-binding-like beta-propeller repeat protein [Acidobacteriota bacterium]
MLRYPLVVLLLLGSAAAASAEDWPGFRGLTRQGVSTETGLPLRWSPTENVAWKTPISGAGWSSPIVWGKRIFLTTATDEGTSCHVLALDAETGEVLWDRRVFGQDALQKREQNSYASPTPVTDGETVFAVFGGGGVAALDFDGNMLWTNRDFDFYSEHGLGASPILYKDTVIMTFDPSSRTGRAEKIGWKVPWNGAALWALDKKTGKRVWEAKRGPSRLAHVTPNFMEAAGRLQLVSGAGDVIQGFDPDTGERLWSVYSQGEGVVPSIVVGGGLAYSISGFEATTIRAVAPGGKIVWEQTRSASHIPSMIYDRGLLFNMHEGGVATCMDAETGEVIWQQRVGGQHWASPVLADGRIYFLSEAGETIVIEPGREYKELARSDLGERTQASMAVSGGRLYIRTADHLWAIGPR